MATLSELANLFRFGRNRIAQTPNTAFQTTLNINILNVAAGDVGWLDLTALPGGQHGQAFNFVIEGNSNITAGQVVIEGSADLSTSNLLEYTNTVTPTGYSANAFTVTSNARLNIRVDNPFGYRYVRCRISTAFTGTATGVRVTNFWVEPVSVLQQMQRVFLANSPNVSTVSTVTAATVTSNTAAVNSVGVDVASSAITASNTTAAFTPSGANSMTFQLAVTAVSGTSPTLQVTVEESLDSGTTWQAVYRFPVVTSATTLASMPIPVRGNRVRYVQTVGGTSPSFTRSITRIMSQAPAPTTNSGRQNWVANVETLFNSAWNPLSTSSFVVGENVLAGSTIYNVPAGQRLKITALSFSGFTNSFLGANSASYDDGAFTIAIAPPGSTPTSASARIATVPYVMSYVNPTGVSSVGTYITRMVFPEGGVEVPSGWNVSIGAQNTNNPGGPMRCRGSVVGDLYNG